MVIEKISKGCVDITPPVSKKSSFSIRSLYISDIHWDNPKCNRKWLTHLLDQALEENIMVFSFGDLFCMMQGKYDPRRSKKDIRPEHNVSNYIDAVVDDATEYFSKYKEILAVFSLGNHETAVIKNLETSPLDRLTSNLRSKGSQVVTGPYAGFIRHKMQYKTSRATKTTFFHHGKWGGIVTKGTLSSMRYSSVAPQADVIVSGHTHSSYSMNMSQYKLMPTGEVKVIPQIHLKCGTFKEEFKDMEGWAVEKIVMPGDSGMWWVDHKFKRGGQTVDMWVEPKQAVKPPQCY